MVKIVQVGLSAVLIVTLAAAIPGLYYYTESGHRFYQTPDSPRDSTGSSVDRLDLRLINNVSKPSKPKPSELPETKFTLDELTGPEKQQARRALRVDINQAGSSGLERIPGVGPSTARDIIKFRENHTIDSVNELAEITGIGPATVDNIEDRVMIHGSLPDNE